MLPAHLVGLADELKKRRVQILRPGQSKLMDDVSRREFLDARDERMPRTSRENEVSGEPVLAWLESRETHSCVKGDPGLLGEDLKRPELADDSVEARSNGRIRSGEMRVEVAERRAGVDLVAVRE